MSPASQAIVFWEFNGFKSHRLRSMVGVLFAYFFVAYSITAIERVAVHHASLDFQAWCVEDGALQIPEHVPISDHQHDAMCCLSAGGNHSPVVLATRLNLFDPRIAFLDQRQILDVGQEPGFPASAYGRSRAPPSLG
jgi:hypothetical protein